MSLLRLGTRTARALVLLGFVGPAWAQKPPEGSATQALLPAVEEDSVLRVTGTLACNARCLAGVSPIVGARLTLWSESTPGPEIEVPMVVIPDGKAKTSDFLFSAVAGFTERGLGDETWNGRLGLTVTDAAGSPLRCCRMGGIAYLKPRDGLLVRVCERPHYVISFPLRPGIVPLP